jgi:hypothetical protein
MGKHCLPMTYAAAAGEPIEPPFFSRHKIGLPTPALRPTFSQ